MADLDLDGDQEILINNKVYTPGSNTPLWTAPSALKAGRWSSTPTTTPRPRWRWSAGARWASGTTTAPRSTSPTSSPTTPSRDPRPPPTSTATAPSSWPGPRPGHRPGPRARRDQAVERPHHRGVGIRRLLGLRLRRRRRLRAPPRRRGGLSHLRRRDRGGPLHRARPRLEHRLRVSHGRRRRQRRLRRGPVRQQLRPELRDADGPRPPRLGVAARRPVVGQPRLRGHQPPAEQPRPDPARAVVADLQPVPRPPVDRRRRRRPHRPGDRRLRVRLRRQRRRDPRRPGV
jgi:hypothetical protein